MRKREELVKDWMATNVITVAHDASLPEAHRLMKDHDIRRLPVLKNGQLVGIITRGDVRGASPSGASSLSIWEMNYLLAKLTVDKVMTRRPITIVPTATVGEAAKVMMDKKVSGLPVLKEDGTIVGVITESDIFRMIVQAWHGE